MGTLAATAALAIFAGTIPPVSFVERYRRLLVGTGTPPPLLLGLAAPGRLVPTG